MKHAVAVVGDIFIDDGEGGAVDYIYYVKYVAEGLGYSSFSCAHAAVKGKNARFPVCVDDVEGNLWQLLKVVTFLFHFLFCA